MYVGHLARLEEVWGKVKSSGAISKANRLQECWQEVFDGIEERNKEYIQ